MGAIYLRSKVVTNIKTACIRAGDQDVIKSYSSYISYTPARKASYSSYISYTPYPSAIFQLLPCWDFWYSQSPPLKRGGGGVGVFEPCNINSDSKFSSQNLMNVLYSSVKFTHYQYLHQEVKYWKEVVLPIYLKQRSLLVVPSTWSKDHYWWFSKGKITKWLSLVTTMDGLHLKRFIEDTNIQSTDLLQELENWTNGKIFTSCPVLFKRWWQNDSNLKEIFNWKMGKTAQLWKSYTKIVRLIQLM